MLLQITCGKCGWWCNADEGVQPNDPNILLCNCCPLWHQHTDECRPVTVTLLTPLAQVPADPLPW